MAPARGSVVCCCVEDGNEPYKDFITRVHTFCLVAFLFIPVAVLVVTLNSFSCSKLIRAPKFI